MAVFVVVVALLASGCVSMMAGLGCAAVDGRCSQETMTSATEADARIAAMMMERAARQRAAQTAAPLK